MESRSRTLVVGLDAACWKYLDPLLQAGRLPHLARLIRQGLHGSLRSTMPPITPTAWSSLVTGVNPGKHGVFEWVRHLGENYQSVPVSANDRVGTPIWNRLNMAGVRVGVVNIPLTFPVQPLDGFLLCGFSTPASARNLTYPPELLTEIEARFGPYRPTAETNLESDDPQVLYAAERDHQKRIVQIAAALARSHDVHVLILNLMLLDHANHTMPTMNLVEQAILDTDEDMGWLLAEFAPDNVLAISDHGSRRVRGQFLLGAWLTENGFLAREERPTSQRAQVTNYLLTQWLNGKSSLVTRAKRYLLRQSLSRLPTFLTSPIWRAIERDVPLALMQLETLNRFAPASTQAYPVSTHRGNLRLNVVNREPRGAILERDRGTVLAQLVEALQAIHDPDTGAPLFSELCRAEDIYSGPFTSDAPDLIGDYYQSDWSMISTLPGLRRRPRRYRYYLMAEHFYGDHSRDGVYVIAGRDFRHDPARSREDLLDIPPTLLHLYGVPQPDDYDGRPLYHAMIAADRSVRYQVGDDRQREGTDFSYSENEEKMVLRRLSQLGYVDGPPEP
jgi:predicted AlkP superfamily phosphohydrolase/phosphomutase